MMKRTFGAPRGASAMGASSTISAFGAVILAGERFFAALADPHASMPIPVKMAARESVENERIIGADRSTGAADCQAMKSLPQSSIVFCRFATPAPLSAAMRIITGSAGGIPIKVPKAETRPTTDRVRQAVFSMLGEEVVGARVLDLFAGSGALGLEALSRGAASALFVDEHPAVCRVIHENLAKSKLKGAEVRQGDALRVLPSLARTGAQFDLVFADPPYAHGNVDFTDRLLASDDLRAVMAPGASFVFECRVTKDGNDSWSDWQIERDREYGSTRILWLRKRGDVESAESDPL